MASKNSVDEKDSLIIWSASGGGWRAQAACIGFANLFGRAGLLPTANGDNDEGNGNKIEVISTNSGASWFSTQFFFSEQFHKRVMTIDAGHGDPSAATMKKLVQDWMEAYADFQRKIEKKHSFVDPLVDPLVALDIVVHGPALPEDHKQMLKLLLHFKNDWASFITKMLKHVSVSAYNDKEFHQILATPHNRIDLLKETALLVHSALVPQTRMDGKTYSLGPSSKEGFKYSGVLPVNYCVDNDSARYLINGHNEKDDPLQVYQSEMDFFYEESHYEGYGLYPKAPKTHIPAEGTKLGAFKTSFFDGKTTASMVASISSAAAGGFSPANPSLFAQETSKKITTKTKNIAEKELARIAVAALFKLDIVKNLSVHTQWPKLGDELDGRFVDGGYDDNASLIQSVAHCQANIDTDLAKTLRIILCLNDIKESNEKLSNEDNDEVLKYFQNDSNQDIPIGDSLWCNCLSNPLVSPQIFKEKKTFQEFNKHTITVPNNVGYFSVTPLSGTTVNNPFWGIRAGQTVEILVIATNVSIPTLVIGSGLAEQYTPPMVNLASELATNTHLLELVKKFVSSGCKSLINSE